MTHHSQRPSDLNSLKIDPSLRDTGSGHPGRWWVPVLIILLVVAGGVLWFARREPVVEVALVQVRKMETASRDTAVLSASGYVEARRQATVSSKITGQVVELFVEEGMEVSEGQVLAKLDNSEAEAQAENARVQIEVARASIPELKIRVEDAERTYKRMAALFDKAAISEEERDQAKTRMESLQAQLAIAESQLALAESGYAIALRHLDNYTIRAPFPGIAISKDAQVGEMISPVSAGGGYTRTGISTIVDMTSLEVEVDVNESFIARVSIGQKVVAVLDAYPDWQIPATVRTVIPAADRQKATVKVRISFDALDPRILPDMGVKVNFLGATATDDPSGGETLPTQSLIVDSKAIGQATDQPHVWLCRSDNTLELRPVRIGRSFQRSMEILDGLRPGDWVVADASLPLKADQPIRAIR